MPEAPLNSTTMIMLSYNSIANDLIFRVEVVSMSALFKRLYRQSTTTFSFQECPFRTNWCVFLIFCQMFCTATLLSNCRCIHVSSNRILFRIRLNPTLKYNSIRCTVVHFDTFRALYSKNKQILLKKHISLKWILL